MQNVGDNADASRIQYKVAHDRLDAANDGEKGRGDVEDFQPVSTCVFANEFEHK